jgi:hypothetical protein
VSAFSRLRLARFSPFGAIIQLEERGRRIRRRPFPRVSRAARRGETRSVTSESDIRLKKFAVILFRQYRRANVSSVHL